MKKNNSGPDNVQPKNIKNTPQKDDSTPKNLPPKEDMPLNQGKENKKTRSSGLKTDQQQSECNDPLSKQVLGRIPDEYHGDDDKVIPEQGLGRIPDEDREEVEEKSKNI